MFSPFAALALALLVSEARAQPPPAVATLDWRAPNGCLDAERLRAEVEARLGRRAFVSDGPADLRIHGRISRHADAWVATIVLLDVRGRALGTRELREESATCSALDQALALVVALAVDAWAERAPRPAPPTPSETRAELSTAAAFVLGKVPGLGTGLEVSAGLTPPSFVPLEAAVVFWSPADSGGAIGARFTAWDARAGICPLFLEWVSACAAAEVGAIHASGSGLDFNDEPTRANVSIVARAKLFLPIGRTWGLSAATGVGVPLLRRAFFYSGSAVQDGGVLYTQWPVLFGASIGASLRF